MASLESRSLDRPSDSVTGLGDVRTGLLLILAGCLPFVLGLVYSAAGGAGRISGACPFLAATGVPCPLCGGTRAFAFVTSGDLAFLDYNAFWVFAAAGLVVLGLSVIFTRFSLKGFWSRRDNLAVYLVPAVFLAAWACALLNRGTIT
ncbi:MAG: DUF2752 domain-containing protein [Thermoleophilia bacterium]|nr:DUF2752 domain-containing protein [Thermoleophilia bacterium]